MLRKTYLTVGLLWAVFGMASVAHAAPCTCSGGDILQTNGSGGSNDISNALNDKVVCAQFGSEKWQERHSGGRIIELGNTANGEDVGSWSTTGAGDTSAVVYSYTGGSSYTYEVCKQDELYHFCGLQYGGRNITNATVGAGKCF